MRRVLACAAMAASLMACGGERPRPTASGPGIAPSAVRTAAVEREAGAGDASVPATVRARQRAALAARIAAAVVELPFREGDKVAAGAVVARLDDAALRSGLAAAEAAARAADADQARTEALLGKGAATPREAEENRTRAAAAGAMVAAARENLAYAMLRAPFDGTVAARPASVGDVVSPGTTILEIEGGTGLELRASLEPELSAGLRPGLALEAHVDGQPAALRATVRAVAAAGDPATHRFEIVADLPRAEGLRSGLFGRLLLPSQAAVPRLLVPTSAVFQRGGLNGVFVVAESKARLRWVAVGASRDGTTEIRAGVEAGERVALEPAGLLDGQAVSDSGPGAR